MGAGGAGHGRGGRGERVSELRRGWWKEDRKTFKVTKMDLGSGEVGREDRYSITEEEMQHIRDAFEFVDQCGCRTMAAAELLNRGTPPEPEKPEWLPCPWCGTTEHLEVRKSASGTRPEVIYCGGCGAYGPYGTSNRDATVDDWNNRDRMQSRPCPEVDPEPEWLPVGVAPDREGRWESDSGRCFQVFSVNSKLWMSSMGDGVEHVRLPLDWFPRKGLRFRRIGDL